MAEIIKTHIVVIGGSYAGLMATRAIFQKVRDEYVHVTLISPNSYAYWNVAAPRILITPERIEEALFLVPDFLTKCSEDSTTFLEGRVVETNFDEKWLMYKNARRTSKVEYDYLIIASGVCLDSMTLQNEQKDKDVILEVERLHDRMQKSRSIVVLGGGPTGSEVVGEIGYRFGTFKEITLVTGKKGPLMLMGENASRKAEAMMKNLNIKVINNVRYTSFELLEYGRSRIFFDDGSSMVADTVINTSICKPNTDFIDKRFVDEKGFLMTDKYLRIESHPEVMGLGDVLSIAARNIVDLKSNQMRVFGAYVDKYYAEEELTILKPYTMPKPSMAIPISRKGGVGLAYGWALPSFFVRLTKGRDYMLGHAKRYLS